MDIIAQLRFQLESIEFWINMHYSKSSVRVTLKGLERMKRARHRLLKNILRHQIQEYNRD